MDRLPDLERPLVPVARADLPARRPAAPDVEVTLCVHAHADGRQVVVRRMSAEGRTLHIDAVVR